MSKHTPGPWFFEPQTYKSSSFYIRGSYEDGRRLTWGKGCVAHIPRSTVMPLEANARLIAAAPELLEMLKAVVQNASECIDGQLVYQSIKLIQKAEGVTK